MRNAAVLALILIACDAPIERILAPAKLNEAPTAASLAVDARWVFRAAMPIPRSGSATAALNGQLYVVGDAFDRALQRYNPATDSWAVLPAMQSQHAYPASAAANGKIYVFGGCTFNSDCRISTSNFSESFDPVANAWSAIPPMPTPRFDAIAVTIDEKIWVFGGTGPCPPCTPIQKTEIFDPRANTWSGGPAILPPDGSIAVTGVAQGGVIYVVVQTYAAGRPASTTLKKYEVATGTLRDLIALPLTQPPIGAALSGGQIYIMPSFDFDAATSTSRATSRVLIYDIAANRLSEGPPLNRPRYSARPQAIDGVVYVSGNGEGNTPSPLFESLDTRDPLNGRIVFTSQRDGPGNIYVMDADGSNQIPLTSDPFWDLSPAWSPDGTRIAFEKEIRPNRNIYVMDANGSNVQQLTEGDFNSKPAWSPDGTRIAFMSFRDGNFEIYVMNADGSNQARLTTHGSHDQSPHWSPDGSKIVWWSSRESGPQIWMMNASGSNPVRLTTGPGDNVYPKWSPDGRQIVFNSNRDNGDYEIYKMDADGSNQIRLTNNPGPDLLPAWSPDGRHIVFASRREGSLDIYIIGADGSSPRRLTQHPSEDLDPDWFAGAAPPPVNKAPTASLVAPANALEGSEFEITANVSDPEGDPLRVAFDSDGDGAFDRVHDDVTGPTVRERVSFPDNGSRGITVQVSDGKNSPVETSATVTIDNYVPQIVSVEPLNQTLNLGETARALVHFEDKGVKDHPWTVKVAWSDGVETIVTTEAQAGPVEIARSFTNDGTFRGTATVTDKDKAVSPPAPFDVTVVRPNTAPTVNLVGAAEVKEGSTETYTAQAIDADGDPLTYEWRLDNVVIPDANGTTLHRAFDDNGSFNLSVKVSDNRGASAIAEFFIRVNNVAPTGTFSAPESVMEGASFSIGVSDVTDPSAVDRNAGFEYAFDCGQGFETFSADPAISCDAPDNTALTVQGQVRDKDGGISKYTTTVTVANVPPTARLVAPATVTEGSTIQFSLADAFDPSPADRAALTFAFACGTGPFSAAGASTDFACPTNDDGDLRVQARIADKDGGQTTYEAIVQVANVAPTGSFSAPRNADEGSSFAVRLSDIRDPSSADREAGFTYAFDCGTGLSAFASNPSATCEAADDGTLTVRGAVRDVDGGTTQYTADVVIANVAPVLSALTAPVSPAAVGSSVTVSATFTDRGGRDTHDATVDWGDGTSSRVSVTEANGSGSVSGSHSYAAAGIYTLTLTVVDDDRGMATSTYRYVVVYDASAGFVTGGGWINSRPGAFAANPALTGRATFGLGAKYEAGANTPRGNTEFQLHAGGRALNFKSTSYEWLVVSGARATYQGVGTINGTGRYRFMVTLVDGKESGGGGVDRFRLRIWDANGGSIYDSQLGAADNADPTTALGGGSIVVHN